MTRRLAIVAHFDARGELAPHVTRQLDMLARSFDRVIVASTSRLSDDARDQITKRADLVERSNLGQDFGSWHQSLEMTGFAADYDELLLTNDSYVSVIDDLEPVMASMAERPVEVWGLTKSWRHTEHIQSYFLHFTKAALRSQAFHRFWSDFRPAADRTSAIMGQELGISRAMMASGFRLGSYFEPTTAERHLANRRGVHWLLRRRRAFPAHFAGFEDHFRIRHARDPEESNRLNWATDFADFVFDRARYPLVKFDTLRYDPHWLDSAKLLALCEEEFPDAFAGVRSYMDETAHVYPGRPLENSGSARLDPITARAVGYRRQRSRGLKE
ncbi:Rhamnan synthesis protein F [Microbacterium sp. LKL04]|nr:Rhamnan synthesis protein F [Microbacterium sp. LKL04]